MQQELEHAVRAHRLPHERKGELEHLGGYAESGMATETTPGKSRSLKGVVENDAVPLGDEQGLGVSIQGMEVLGDGVSGEIARRGFDNREGAISLKGF